MISKLKAKELRLLIHFQWYFKKYNWIQFYNLIFYSKHKNYTELSIEFKFVL